MGAKAVKLNIAKARLNPDIRMDPLLKDARLRALFIHILQVNDRF